MSAISGETMDQNGRLANEALQATAKTGPRLSAESLARFMWI